MLGTQIRKLEILGFRAFGSERQILEIDSALVNVWGPNSKGKTSLAEAIEFLLTGQIVRRELTSSTKDEFANALRNAHLPAETRPYVEAALNCNGTIAQLRRTLLSDYTKQADCQSQLELDGAVVPEEILSDLDIVLSQPPLRAPVLAQHTLSYLFSARPSDRSGYFKALLEVADLAEFRDTVAALQDELESLDDPWVTKLENAAVIPAAVATLSPLLQGVPTPEVLEEALSTQLPQIGD